MLAVLPFSHTGSVNLIGHTSSGQPERQGLPFCDMCEMTIPRHRGLTTTRTHSAPEQPSVVLGRQHTLASVGKIAFDLPSGAREGRLTYFSQKAKVLAFSEVLKNSTYRIFT